METVNLSLPSTDHSDTDQKYRDSFWRWFEILSSIGEKYYMPDWLEKDNQDPDKWPFY